MIWQTKKLGEVLEKTETINPALKPEEDFDYIDVSSVSNKTFTIENTLKIRGKNAPSRARKKVRTGDIIFATIRPTLKRIATIPSDLDGQICSTGYFVLRAKEIILSPLLYYFLLSETFNARMEKLQKGASYPAVTDSDVKNQIITFPESLPEQLRIVKILDEVFEGVGKAKENAERNLKNSRLLFESYLQSVFSDQNDGWEEKKLGDKSLFQIIDGDRGKNYPKKSDFSPEGYCLFLNTKNVRPDGFDFQTTMFVTEKKDKALGNGKLQKNDVLLTTRGTIGNIAVYDETVPFENIRINSGMLIFRPNTKVILPEYLFSIFQSGIMKTQIKKYVSGAAQPQLPIKTLVNFSIPVPKSLPEQKAIVAKLDALSAETKKLEGIYRQKIADVDELKKSVLKKAFSREL